MISECNFSEMKPNVTLRLVNYCKRVVLYPLPMLGGADGRIGGHPRSRPRAGEDDILFTHEGTVKRSSLTHYGITWFKLLTSILFLNIGSMNWEAVFMFRACTVFNGWNNVQSSTCARTHIHTRTCTHIRRHAHTHARTHAQTHTL